MPGDDNPQSIPATRLTSLEEHGAFLERSVDQLSEEVRLLNDRTRQLTQRLALLESKLGKLEAGPSESDTVDGD